MNLYSNIDFLKVYMQLLEQISKPLDFVIFLQ